MQTPAERLRVHTIHQSNVTDEQRMTLFNSCSLDNAGLENRTAPAEGWLTTAAASADVLFTHDSIFPAFAHSTILHL